METATQTPATIFAFEGVNPINTAEAGITAGHYNDHYKHITDKTVPLQPAQGPKKLYFVCFNRTIGETEWTELLRAEGKQPCKNGPNYLLGLMAQVPEGKMPEELRNKDLVAAENEKSSVFAGRIGDPCFLCVNRLVADRELGLARVAGGWLDGWAFLAEDLVP